MGSGGETAEETVKYLAAKGEKVGVVACPPVSPLLTGIFHQGTAREREIHRRA